MNGSYRTYKFAHENLREVPRGSLGFLEIAESCTKDDVTADTSHSNDVHEMFMVTILV